MNYYIVMEDIMKIFRGKVISGTEEVQNWIKKLEKKYSTKTGIGLFRNTVNIQLEEPVSVYKNENVIYLNEKSRKKMPKNNQLLSCYLNETKVLMFNVETKKLTDNYKLPTVIEIAVDCSSKQSLRLEEGDEVQFAIPISNIIQKV